MLLASKQSRQSVVLYAATLLGAALGFVASIVNTHYLCPLDYGDVRYVQNIIQLISWVLLFGYFLSGSRLLALTEEEAKRRKIRGCLVLILCVCSLLLLFSTCVAGFMHNESLRKLFMLSLPVCFYPLLLNYMNTTPQGDNHIGRMAIARVLPALLYIPIAWLIYSTAGATSALMILLQWGLYSIILIAVIASTRPSFKDIRGILPVLRSENRSYGIQLYYGSLAMVATNYLAGVMLGVFNDNNANVGYYTLALTLTAPLSYLPGIIGTVYFRSLTTQSFIPKDVLKKTLLLTVITCILFVLIVRPVVSWCYSPEYACVGRYACWLSIGFSIHGLGDMLNRYLASHGQGVSIRNSSFACGFIKILGFTLLVWLWDINGALLTNVAASTVYFLALLFYYIRFIKENRQ